MTLIGEYLHVDGERSRRRGLVVQRGRGTLRSESCRIHTACLESC